MKVVFVLALIAAVAASVNAAATGHAENAAVHSEGADAPHSEIQPTSGEDSDSGSSESNEDGDGSGEGGSGSGEEGDACNPDDCVNTGDCQHYLRCDNGTLVRDECGEGLFWNPFEADCSTRQIHGGNCDKYDNLCQATKDAYHNSKECLKCFWEEDGKCSQTYRYQAPNLKNRNVQTLSCRQGLVFVEAKQTCQRCEDARDENGNACCAGSNIIF